MTPFSAYIPVTTIKGANVAILFYRVEMERKNLRQKPQLSSTDEQFVSIYRLFLLSVDTVKLDLATDPLPILFFAFLLVQLNEKVEY